MKSDSQLIYFLDSDPYQHDIFVRLFGESYKIRCFDNLADLLGQADQASPDLLVCEVSEFLDDELGALSSITKIWPDVVVLLVFDISEANLMDFSPDCRVFDYVVKPWVIPRLAKSIENALLFRKTEAIRSDLASTLVQNNEELQKSLAESEKLLAAYKAAEEEIKCWVHPFVLEAAKQKLKFPLERDLALLVFDIVNSGQVHGQQYLGMPLRTRILQTFWEIILKHGGEVESYEGDKGYATFGLIHNSDNYSNAAFAAAKEIRSAVQAINDHFNTLVEAGIAIHFASRCLINLRQVAINASEGVVTRKWFDTSSSDVDLCHRLESLSHKLPGSNIMLTEAIIKRITSDVSKVVDIGSYVLKGQANAHNFYLLHSHRVTSEEIEKLKQYLKDNFSVDKQKKSA